MIDRECSRGLLGDGKLTNESGRIHKERKEKVLPDPGLTSLLPTEELALLGTLISEDLSESINQDLSKPKSLPY